MASFSLRNFGLKVLSICIATLLWLVVAGERVVERVLRVPVELQNLPPELEIVSNPPDTVEVRVRGSSGTLSRMTPGEVSTVIDLRAARTGRRLFHLTPGQVKTPVRPRNRPGVAPHLDDGVRDDGHQDGAGAADDRRRRRLEDSRWSA